MSRPSNAEQRFYDAAMEILAQDGVGALKLKAVCQHLDLSTGSFYFSFASWSEFTDQLLENWYRERTGRLADAARSSDDPSQRVENLLQVGLSLQHSAEASIRVWAGISPHVADVQRRVDDEALALVTEALAQLVGDVAEAEVLAHAAIYAVIGYEAHSSRNEIALEFVLREIQQRVQRIADERRAAGL